MINKLYKPPRCISYWVKLIPKMEQLENDHWEEMFQMPEKCISEVKIQVLQYKLLHNIINFKKN